MPPTATKAPPRKSIDDAALAAELEAERGEADGLGPAGDPPVDPPADPPAEDPPAEDPPSGSRPDEVTQEEYEDPNSEFNTGIPGGRKPGDDGYVPPDAIEPPANGGNGEPPTPAAKLPEGEGGAEDEEEPDKLAITGDRELGLKVGGRKPDSATLHLKGGKIELTGPKGSQFDRGDRFLTVSTLQVTGDDDKDTIVKHSGEVTSTSKKQVATLCGIVRLEEWVQSRVEGKQLTAEQVDWLWDVLELDPEA